MFPFPIAALAEDVVPGSQSYTVTGTYQFLVPNYNTLTVTVRGGGAQGYEYGPGNAGGASSFNGNVIANGGQSPVNTDAGGAGGTASGGDQNYTGESGALGTITGGTGGAGANGGGAGGTDNKGAGVAPGGGGAGGVIYFVGAPGGGGGGCAVKTYTSGLVVGSLVEVIVGAGGAGAPASGGAGARGQVDISWN